MSRYGAYLGQHLDLFQDDGAPTDDAGRFASAAWRVAHPPIMAPGYVRTDGRVQDSDTGWDDERRPAVCVDVAVSLPPEAAGLGYPWRHWICDESGRWQEPDEFTDPIAVTVLHVIVPLARIRLPQPRYRHDCPDTTTAKRAVQAICALLNTHLAAVIAHDPLTRTAP